VRTAVEDCMGCGSDAGWRTAIDGWEALDARLAGCARVAVVAREGAYPWRRRIYWVADGSGMRANLRPTDTLQLLLHAIDEVAGPGTVARID